jgi:hypothetical protein
MPTASISGRACARRVARIVSSWVGCRRVRSRGDIGVHQCELPGTGHGQPVSATEPGLPGWVPTKWGVLYAGPIHNSRNQALGQACCLPVTIRCRSRLCQPLQDSDVGYAHPHAIQDMVGGGLEPLQNLLTLECPDWTT